MKELHRIKTNKEGVQKVDKIRDKWTKAHNSNTRQLLTCGFEHVFQLSVEREMDE